MKYDSENETKRHKLQVAKCILRVIALLTIRGEFHDDSKLQKPEKKLFDKYTPLLSHTSYGTEKYKTLLKKLKPALDHHYRTNSHHPEHYTNLVDGMNLIDIIEMLCDWKAASKRHLDGDIYKSIEINQQRFRYSTEFKRILINTAKYLF